MLPFGKKDQDSIVSGPPSKMHRSEDTDFGHLDAIAGDMMSAFQSGDSALLRQALESFRTYIQTEDVAQDEEQFNRGMT